jgi:hypothetical protein
MMADTVPVEVGFSRRSNPKASTLPESQGNFPVINNRKSFLTFLHLKEAKERNIKNLKH